MVAFGCPDLNGENCASECKFGKGNLCCFFCDKKSCIEYCGDCPAKESDIY